MKLFNYCLLVSFFFVSCQNKTITPNIKFERIDYFSVKNDQISETPFKSRLQYYLDDGRPHRYLEIDTNGHVLVEYIWEYDKNGVHNGAIYTEYGEEEFSVEKVSYSEDNLVKTTEWLDSAGNPYYKMVEDLNKWQKPDRAAFIGEKLHGYDTTYYNNKGDELYIFFTNTKGKIFNDRTFKYINYNENDHWTLRNKIMKDTIREQHQRTIYYDDTYWTIEQNFMEGILSMPNRSENYMSFTASGDTVLFTRGKDWQKQIAYFSRRVNGVFREPQRLDFLDTIYNAAISPLGQWILYNVRDGEQSNIWLACKNLDNSWINMMNVTKQKGFQGGYFNWYNEHTVYFYVPENEGDLVVGFIDKGLEIMRKLDQFNTKKGCEFSPYMDKEKRFFIFTRYLEGDTLQQGFFISYNIGSKEKPDWTDAQKIKKLPYGWGAFVSNDLKYLYWTDGEDLKCNLIEELDLEI